MKVAETESSGLQRDIAIFFRVSEKEKALIDKGMKASGAKSIREYLTTMAIEGHVVHVDVEPIRQGRTSDVTHRLKAFAVGSLLDRIRLYKPDLLISVILRF